jgi:hypothetical protein
LCERPLEEDQGATTQRISIHLKHLLSLKNILIHEKGPQRGPHQWVNSWVTLT